MSVVIYEKTDHIATVLLNRPKAKNSLSPELLIQLNAACEDADRDPEIRVAIISTTDETCFCAGADLKKMIPLLTGARKPETDDDTSVLEMLNQNDRPLPIRGQFGKPIITAVEGIALGGGLELALAGDLIIAGENARFGAPEVSAGAYPVRLSWLLQQRLPYSIAAEILLTGKALSAERAHQHGLINRVVGTGEALETARTIASSIAENAPLSVQGVRHVARSSLMGSVEDVDVLDQRTASSVFSSEDAREGPKAFAEKRKPTFRGK